MTHFVVIKGITILFRRLTSPHKQFDLLLINYFHSEHTDL